MLSSVINELTAIFDSMNDIKVLRNIQKHVLLTDQERDLFVSSITLKEISRKEFVLKQSQVCKKNSFLLKGAVLEHKNQIAIGCFICLPI